MKIKVTKKDLRIDTFRDSGPGGQHRNKTDSAVRITHLPSGVVVTATEERSQARNKKVAIERLRVKLKEYYERDMIAERRGAAKDHKKNSVRGNHIRTYKFSGKRPMVIDHRTGVKVTDVKSVMDGDLTPFIEAARELKRD